MSDTTAKIKEGLKFGIKEAFAAAGGFAGLAAVIRGYFFPNTSPDSDKTTPGLQSNKNGKTIVDEALFLEALSIAMDELSNEFTPSNKKKYGTKKLNKLAKTVMDVFKTYNPPERAQIILALGLGEKSHTDKIPGKDDKGNTIVIERTFDRNSRGITILKRMLLMDPETIQSVLDSLVLGSQHFDYRWQQLNCALKSFNDAADEFFEDILPKSRSTMWDSVPIINLIMAKRAYNKEKNSHN